MQIIHLSITYLEVNHQQEYKYKKRVHLNELYYARAHNNYQMNHSKLNNDSIYWIMIQFMKNPFLKCSGGGWTFESYQFHCCFRSWCSLPCPPPHTQPSIEDAIFAVCPHVPDHLTWFQQPLCQLKRVSQHPNLHFELVFCRRNISLFMNSWFQQFLTEFRSALVPILLSFYQYPKCGRNPQWPQSLMI